jgi:hypothetical protein
VAPPVETPSYTPTTTSSANSTLPAPPPTSSEPLQFSGAAVPARDLEFGHIEGFLIGAVGLGLGWL